MLHCDYLVIGGGLGGLTAANVLAEAGCDVVLVDRSLPEARGALGGFTRFSGAKFSLLPAGQGLAPVAGGLGALRATTQDVLAFCDLADHSAVGSLDLLDDQPIGAQASMRAYQSIVLTPQQVERLVERISGKVGASIRVIDAGIDELRPGPSGWLAFSRGGAIVEGRVAIFCGGRMGGTLLRRAGAMPQEGKGIDLGVRIEFAERESLRALRDRGPDAKILIGPTRTFCLNSPGTIFRYGFRQITIPGGIVADTSERGANFGILTRVQGKEDRLGRVLRALRTVPPAEYEAAPTVKGAPFQDKTAILESAYGFEVVGHLKKFAETLGELGLVDWTSEHRIHFPLLDWHWDTFAVGHSHRTSQPNLFVAGDAAGHARGLLQAGVSGWLAAREALADASL
ncbi:FAD-dependent oxidoreductase [Mesorhizobium sp. WSM1293]|uniref:FAD-dependent oxidoreductase n=1 Tax=Mesorhizobium sp. WSM1293 TaxID=1040984 RepID=UPI001FD9E48A|nr:FAD-dependent oxidoreductase [Mesorhizobium sp. WSM1293]